jgi:hypothetical protein
MIDVYIEFKDFQSCLGLALVLALFSLHKYKKDEILTLFLYYFDFNLHYLCLD